jgi:hypothetical protein
MAIAYEMYREQGGLKLEGVSFRTAHSFPFLRTQIIEQINLQVSEDPWRFRLYISSCWWIRQVYGVFLHSIGMAKEIVLLY